MYVLTHTALYDFEGSSETIIAVSESKTRLEERLKKEEYNKKMFNYFMEKKSNTSIYFVDYNLPTYSPTKREQELAFQGVLIEFRDKLKKRYPHTETSDGDENYYGIEEVEVV